MELEYKKARLEFKKDKPGAFRIVFAETGVIDLDSDVTSQGAFPTGKMVPMSAYGHGSWQGELPVGKAVITEEGNEAIAEGEFFLNTTQGKDHYETVKALGDIQEYSYGFKPTEFEFGEFEGKDVRFLKKVDVFEISPVLKGAGIGTHTQSIKSDKELTFNDEFEAVLATNSKFVERCKGLAALRATKGKELSTANKERLTSLLKSLTDLEGEIKTLLESSKPVGDEGKTELLRLLKMQSQILEVI